MPINIDGHIQALYRMLSKSKNFLLYGKPKGHFNHERDPNSRGSNYTGVSRNGLNWQAHINNGHGKKYIGTYASDKEAGIAYDFYAIVLQKSKAKTNFCYSKEKILMMLRSYLDSKKKFDPCSILEYL